MPATIWRCKCGATYEVREEWHGRKVRCKHCGVITRVEKPSSTSASPPLPRKAPPPLPKTSLPSRETRSQPPNKTEVDRVHDRDRDLPNTLIQTEPSDVNESALTTALDVVLAAEDAGIQTFDKLVAFSVTTIGENKTRWIGAYLRLAAEQIGMKGIRKTGDVLAERGGIRAQDLEEEIKSLESKCRTGVATSYDLHELGNAYYNYRDLAKALKYFRLSADAKPIANDWMALALLANTWVRLALVYSDSELSQDADAADACRRALALKPDEERAKELLEATKRKLVPLATQALSAASGLVESDEFFDFYISPFEMLQIADSTVANGPDLKAIQQAKKRLLHELELNDGKVSWLGDYPLDKARAIAVVDELDDEAKRRYHVAVYRNNHLLNFLTRGDIRHFLYRDDYFPCDTEELLQRELGFRTFLSKPFAKQYNRVVTRAIDDRRLSVVEVLFDGRRWVEPEDDDQCFDGASKRVGDVVEEMRAIVRDCTSRKVSLREIEDFLHKNSLPELFNLLPIHFASYQGDIVKALRFLAISCFNDHDDSILSRDVLNLCKRFTSRDIALNEQLREDFKTVEAMISAERGNKATQQVSSTQTKIWFYFSNGTEYGPFDPEVVIELARAGVITPATMVRCKGREYGKALSFGFLATVFNDSTSAKPRRPATAVGRNPELNAPSEVLAYFSEASRSFLWFLGRVFAVSPVMFLLGLMVLIGFVVDSCSTRKSPRSRSSNDPNSSLTSRPNTPSSESKSLYRIPSHSKAELDKQIRAIDTEKATAERMEAQLEILARELERAEAYLDHTNGSAVDDYNRKVKSHNSLLERVRAKNRHVNQIVDNYNEKLRKHGR
jgi:tetratricopeptide (TPR) repeat protein